MIVRVLEDRLQLVTQPDHAHAARAIMEHCVPLAAHPRRDAILHATGEHDNGWAEEDAAPALDPVTGAVVDFVTAPLSVRHAVWPRAVARLAGNPWAAALVAQHALTVYDRFRADAAWSAFFTAMEEARNAMVRASGMPLEALAADYAFVRLADLISLTFCTGWTDEQRFAGWRVQPAGSHVLVTPDPFGGAAIPIAIEAVELRRVRFQTDAELREGLRVARAVTLTGEVRGQTAV